MRQRTSIDTIAVLLAAAALVVIVMARFEWPPRPDRPIHQAIGRALAQEALNLLPSGGEITVITRDTEAYRQPAIEIALKSFQRELKKAGAAIAAIHRIQVDPLRPVEVPPGDFYELIRRAADGQVIVSFLGPPVLTEEQEAKLKPVKPKVVAFCSGNLSEAVDLRRLFRSGLLHVALVNRRSSSPLEAKLAKDPDRFDQLYAILKAGDLSKLARSSEGAFDWIRE